MPSYNRGVAPLPASSLEYHLVREIFRTQRRYPVEELLLVVIAKVAPARPFFRKTRGRLEFDARKICRQENWDSVADREFRTATLASWPAGDDMRILRIR